MTDELDLSQFSMADLFRMEVETHTQFLVEGLLVLEKDSQSPEVLQSLMRAAHSLKGAARIMDLQEAVTVAHRMEDCFVAAQQETLRLSPDTVDTLLQGVDFLQQMAAVPEAEQKQWLTAHQSFISDFTQALTTGTAGQSRSPHPRPAVEDIVNLPTQPPEVQPPEPQVQAITVASPVPSELQLAPSNPLDEVAIEAPAAQTLDLRERGKSDRVVRLSADNLNRLMGLAGESLVEANWLQPFADSLLHLKHQQRELASMLERLQESLIDQTISAKSCAQVQQARQQMATCNHILMERLNALEGFARRSANLSDRLYREVIAGHMRPFGDGVQAFPRLVRDLSRRLNKQVRFEIKGNATQVDRDILEKLEAPLTHILQNAIDHGIESVPERLAMGKPAEGLVQIEATHRAGMLSITISDDGRGIDLDQLRQKIVRQNRATPEMAAQLTDSELMEFLFLPGFSTAEQLTDLSGRGVGLDAAQSMVHDVGGTIRATSRQGQGMAFHLQLPLTLSVIRALVVEIAGEPYAFPLTRLDHLCRVPRSQVTTVENRQYFTLEAQNVGLVAGHQVLQLEGTTDPLEDLPTLIVSDRLSTYGLVVDRFLGEQNLVVRPLDSRLGKVPNIRAAALLDDGTPVLIIDVEDMVRSIDHLFATGQVSHLKSETETATKRRKRILVVDDSITVREMERKLLENRGYQVDVAVNGMDGWNAIRTGNYDLIVTDIDMPRMNGIELVNQIKTNPQLNSLPIIIVSYKDREEDRMRGLQAGANYYLTKSSFHDNSLIHAAIDLIGEA